jgi:N-sulfoglucosamine sulfohydrolase
MEENVTNSRPNILVITCHDLGDYLGSYGEPVDTPNLDELGNEGVLFKQHFSAASVCSPSRGSLWTGCYAHTHGLMGLVPRGWEIDNNRCPHAASILKSAGYQSHLFGLQHEHWDPFSLGFDQVHDVPSNFCDHVTPVFTKWLKAQTNSVAPFFAAIGFFEVHRIGSASQGPSKEFIGQSPSHFKRDVYNPDDPKDVQVRPYLLDNPELREELADFYGSIMFMDQMVGEILTALDQSGLRDDTLVIFTSDHGASFLHSKATLYDGGLKVPLIMCLPGVIPEGREVFELVSNVDVLPTILELVDVPIPENVQGRSFTDLVKGQPTEAREYVFAEKNYTNYFDPARMVRSKHYKYIRNGLRKGIFDFVITEIEMSQASFRNNLEVFKFYDSRRVNEELYDLEQDPAELHNLVYEPDYRDVRTKMWSVLKEHLEKTDDPFRHFHNEILMPEDVYPDVKGIRESQIES